MQLTRYTDYSLRVLIFLSLQKGKQLITISDISEHFDIPRNHLVKVVHQLGILGYINTTRGKHGGMCLASTAEQIKIGYVIRQMEKTLDVVHCDSPTPCPIGGNCKLKLLLNEATEAFLGILDQYTIADLGESPDQMKNLLHIQFL